MNYKLEIKDGKYNVLSPQIGMYVIEAATIDEVKMALATELEYSVKLKIVKLLMTFPHGFSTVNNEVIVHSEAVDAYHAWHDKIHQRIGFLEEYYSLIDEKIMEVLT